MTWTSGPCEPATDETTARDRAINTVEDVVMGGHASMNTARRQATAIVDALLARPEVLRALAGAPTADEIPDRCPAHGAERCPKCSRISTRGLTDDGLSCRGCGYWGATGMHWDTCPHRIRGEIVNAPTVDVATEPVASSVRGAADWLLYFYAEPKHQGEDDQTAAAYWALGPELAGKLIDAFRELARLRAAAPEGVDVADERRQLVDLVKLGEEKQQLLADQLAAAQAAIGRVRELHVADGDMCAECGHPSSLGPCPTVRALDGDTTEEK